MLRNALKEMFISFPIYLSAEQLVASKNKKKKKRTIKDRPHQGDSGLLDAFWQQSLVLPVLCPLWINGRLHVPEQQI